MTALSRREVTGADRTPARGDPGRHRRGGRRGGRRPAAGRGWRALVPAALAAWYVGQYGTAQARVAADPAASRVRAAVGAGITGAAGAAGRAGRPDRRPGCRASRSPRPRRSAAGWPGRCPRHERRAAVRLRHQRLRQPPARRRAARSSPTWLPGRGADPRPRPPRPVRARSGRAGRRARPTGWPSSDLGAGDRDRRPLPARPVAQARAHPAARRPGAAARLPAPGRRDRRRPRRRGGLVLGRGTPGRRWTETSAWDRLVDGCAEVRRRRRRRGVTARLRAGAGHAGAGHRRLAAAAARPRRAGRLRPHPRHRTLPVPGAATGARTASPTVAAHLVNVQIDDMRRGVHEHLEFGTGEIDFPPVLRALADAGYTGLVAVELPRALARRAGRGRALASTSCAPPQASRDSRRPTGRDASGRRAHRPTGRCAERGPDTAAALGRTGPDWLDEAVRRVAADPAAVGRLFAAAGRRCGRAALPDAPGWTADDAARALLLAALPADRVGRPRCETLYRYGDAAEKRAVLRALPLLPIGDAAVPLLHDAIRTNDTRLVAAALGPYAGHLDAADLASGGAQVRLHGRAAGRRRPARRARRRRAGDDARRAGRGAHAPPAATMPADATALLDRLADADDGRRRDAHLRPAHPHDLADHRRLRADGRRRRARPGRAGVLARASRAPTPARSPTTSTRWSAGSRSGPASSASGTTPPSR